RGSCAAPAPVASRVSICDRHAGSARNRSAADFAIFAERTTVVTRLARRRGDRDRRRAAALQRALFWHRIESRIFRVDRARIVHRIPCRERICANLPPLARGEVFVSFVAQKFWLRTSSSLLL